MSFSVHLVQLRKKSHLTKRTQPSDRYETRLCLSDMSLTQLLGSSQNVSFREFTCVLCVYGHIPPAMESDHDLGVQKQFRLFPHGANIR